MSLTKTQLIAPCGMNCAICIGYLRDKNKCDGCRSKNSKCGRSCAIKLCKNIKKIKFCSDKCKKFPCRRLKSLDKRYKIKYNMSMLENLSNIVKIGVQAFVKNEKNRWTCIKCGETICVHRKFCLNCKSENQNYKECPKNK